MERLTFEGNFCDIAMCRENPCPYNGSCSQREIWERLKAYEVTGLTPNVCLEYKKFEDEAIKNGATFSRIVELMKADKDGRIVVLPCKVGDTVYFRTYAKNATVYLGILPHEVTKISVITTCGKGIHHVAIPLKDFGKSVFFTKEEAEENQ